jgi:hypothetical protein
MEEHPEEFDSFGCGPGGLGDILVPDKMYGLDVSDACRIHDWYYRFYGDNSEGGRREADEILKNNLLRIVRKKSKSRILRWLRTRRCRTYYGFVRFAGGPAYYSERNVEDEEFRDIEEIEELRLVRFRKRESRNV